MALAGDVVEQIRREWRKDNPLPEEIILLMGMTPKEWSDLKMWARKRGWKQGS